MRRKTSSVSESETRRDLRDLVQIRQVELAREDSGGQQLVLYISVGQVPREVLCLYMMIHIWPYNVLSKYAEAAVLVAHDMSKSMLTTRRCYNTLTYDSSSEVNLLL